MQIGKVTIGGDWIASDLVAGVSNGGDGFGNANDVLITEPDDTQPGGSPTIIASIAKIVIKGQASGTVGGSDHYGHHGLARRRYHRHRRVVVQVDPRVR